MAFTVRKTERDAVVAVLESVVPVLDDEGNPVIDADGEPVFTPAYETPEDMATALVKVVQAELSQRETFAVFPDAGVAGYGPYASAKDAERAWLRQGIGAAYGGHRGRLLTLRPWTEETESALTPCVGCGHTKDQHADKGRCAVFGPSLTGPKARVKPHLPSCPCSAYERSA